MALVLPPSSATSTTHSAAGTLALLSERDPKLQVRALATGWHGAWLRTRRMAVPLLRAPARRSVATPASRGHPPHHPTRLPPAITQEHALRKLFVLVDTAWAEASEYIASIEALAEEEAFAPRQLAAAVASKVRTTGRQRPMEFCGRHVVRT